jgi:hypothetical protein
VHRKRKLLLYLGNAQVNAEKVFGYKKLNNYNYRFLLVSESFFAKEDHSSLKDKAHSMEF